MIGFVDFVLFSLVVYVGAGYLVSEKVFEPLMDRVLDPIAERANNSRGFLWLWDGLTCRVCVGQWVAFGLGLVVASSVWEFFVLSVGFNGLNMVLDHVAGGGDGE